MVTISHKRREVSWIAFNAHPRLTVCVTGAGASVDSAWEQEKLEARKMLENAAESPASSARFVGRPPSGALKNSSLTSATLTAEIRARIL